MSSFSIFKSPNAKSILIFPYGAIGIFELKIMYSFYSFFKSF